MAEVQRTDQEARHDLVAHAQQQRRVEHVVRQAHRGGHRDGVAREQAQLHARQALGDAVAHRRHPAGDLHRGAEAARLVADQRREALIGLVRRQHVVVGGDDADVGRLLGHDADLVRARQRREGVGDVGAAHPVGPARTRSDGTRARQIGLAQRLAAFADAGGDVGDLGFHGVGLAWNGRETFGRLQRNRVTSSNHSPGAHARKRPGAATIAARACASASPRGPADAQGASTMRISTRRASRSVPLPVVLSGLRISTCCSGTPATTSAARTALARCLASSAFIAGSPVES